MLSNEESITKQYRHYDLNFVKYVFLGIMASHTYYAVYNLHSFSHEVPSDQRDLSLIVESSPIHFSKIISDISADIKNFCLNY